MSNRNLIIRRMVDSDLTRVLSWRNSSRIRESMFSDRLITSEEHQSWYHKIKNNEQCIYLVCEDEDQPIGLVYFTDINKGPQNCHWGFYVGDTSQPKGTGYNMCRLALHYAFVRIGMKKVFAEVIENNIPSLKLHQKLGFTMDTSKNQSIIKNGSKTKVVRFYLSKDTWMRLREE